MKTISRLSFLGLANAVWLAQFAVEFLVPLAPDYIAWRLRQSLDTQIGCVGDTSFDVPLDRLYMLGLVWLLSTPLMNLIAWKLPDAWPSRLARFWWNDAARGLSVATLAATLAMISWPVGAALGAPVISTLLVEVARALVLFGVALYYRGVLLSA